MIKFKEFLFERIMKSGEKWFVTTSSGDRVLGSHRSKQKALNQLAAIEISKKKRQKS